MTTRRRSLDNPAGRLAVGALNGLWGDRLPGSAARWPPRWRCAVAVVTSPLDAGSLARAFSDATPRLAVFIHGLCETEDAWRLGADQHMPYGDRAAIRARLHAGLRRYNSGLHISENGRLLARLLDELTANWPVDVAEIALIGHSMGGLVARGACHYAPAGSWRERVRHVFTLGAPHQGAPLELGANAACHAASRLPETRAFATPIKLRSAGVKDLGYGYVVDEDWEGHDPDAFWTNTGTVVPFLASANHYFVSASLSRDPDGPVGPADRRPAGAPRAAPGPRGAAASASSSRSTSTATSAAPPTSTCSTTPRSTTSSTTGSTVGRELPRRRRCPR